MTTNTNLGRGPLSGQPRPTTRPIQVARRPINVAYDIELESELYNQNWQLNRASLRAVIGGTLASLVLMLGMSILGLAIGATTLTSMIDFNADPIFDPEAGVIIWLAVTNILALFTGGWIAGRLAGSPIELDGLIHGFLVWSLVTLVTLWLFTSATGSIISGAAGAVSTGFDVLDGGVETVVPIAIDAIEDRDFSVESIRIEARNLAAENNIQVSDQEGDIVSDAASNIARDPSVAGEEIERALFRLLTDGSRDDLERQDVIDVIVANTNLTEQEARDLLTEWEAEFDALQLQTEETLENVTEDVTEAVALAAGVVFMSMVMGSFAAMAGGFIGAPEYTIREEVIEHEQQREFDEAHKES